jgi:ribonuclease HI
LEKQVKVFTDGASRGNPGKAGIGIVIKDNSDNILSTYKEFIGEESNNSAEYKALIKCIEILKSLQYDYSIIQFFSDSELMVKQISGKYKIKNHNLIKLSLDFWNSINKLNKKFKITHISREKNKLADKLANEAIDYNIQEIDRSLLISN